MEPASARAHQPPNSQGDHEAAGLSREVLEQMGGALRAYYDSQVDSEALIHFHRHLSALDRAEYVHRKGIEAVSRALEDTHAKNG